MNTYPLLRSIKKKVDRDVHASISSFGEKNSLRDACEYALTNGGKRIRSIIVYSIADALQKNLEVTHAALSVEYFHTASLIADDLPCMDDDDERRNKPSLHKVFGESTALLASYALITASFEKIYLAAKEMDDQVCKEALKIASTLAGIQGATGGQYLDLYPKKLNLESIKELIYKKTITLFEVSFLFGWLFGGGNFSQIDVVRKASYHFGMAFQIVDDIRDAQIDMEKERNLNIVSCLGIEKSTTLFEEEIEQFVVALKNLGIHTPIFHELYELLFDRGSILLKG